MEEYAMVPLNEPQHAAAVVTYAVVRWPTPEPPPSLPKTRDSGSDTSLGSPNVCEHGNIQLEDHATSPSGNSGEEDAIPLLEIKT